MSTELQDFNKGAGATFGFVFLVGGLALTLFTSRGDTTSNSLSSRMELGRKIFMFLTFAMWLVSLFLVFSPVMQVAYVTGFVALVGLHAFKTTNMVFLPLYGAIVLYLLPQLSAIYAGVQVTQCAGTFGDLDFCKEKWLTFLSFIFLGYEFFAMGTAFAAFHYFATLYATTPTAAIALHNPDTTPKPTNSSAPATTLSPQNTIFAPSSQPAASFYDDAPSSGAYQPIGGYQSAAFQSTTPSQPLLNNDQPPF